MKTIEHIDRLKVGLSHGKISPNYGNQHVFKIICGAGNNSKTGKGMIKEIINETLMKSNYDFYPNIKHGVFLVRFS